MFTSATWHWGDFPAVHPSVYSTGQGTLYLEEPGIVTVTKPNVSLESLKGYLEGFDPNLKFIDYLDDPNALPPGTQVCKMAGQLCYMSFGPKRSWNDVAGKYFENILRQAHGSVLEHANYGFVFYGISRSLTHELIRHRHFSYSMVSQRYVDDKALRFVMRPEFAYPDWARAMFRDEIDQVATSYHDWTKGLLKEREEDLAFQALKPTEQRIQVQQVARWMLPNATETAITVTGNIRAWRHFLEMRASPFAEPEIRKLAMGVYLILKHLEPILFGDYEVVTDHSKPEWARSSLKTLYLKV